MAEPPVEPNESRRESLPAIPSPDPANALPASFSPKANGQDIFLGPNDPTDDSPTIISRAARRADRPEDGFAMNLRGRTLAHFALIEPIGVGGMAAVIRAFDNQLERSVALKILPPDMATDPENIRRFQQEARAAAKLDHENIARVFFCGEDQGLHFIAFEFVEGENLRTLLERRGRLPLPEAINYMLQVATGLAHASIRGVVHRDIKPSNIIISPNGRAKLVDMGLARSLGPRSDGALTQSGVTLGTFDYISPEQALEPRDADVRSDIYSLGCTFYHMLTGQPPVPEGTAAKKLHHHQHVAPIDPRQLNRDIPDEVAAILARMMAKDAKNRYQRSEHLVQHLIAVAHKLGTATDVPEGVLFVDAPLPGPPQVRPVLMGLLATAALLGLVALLGSWAGPELPPDTTRSYVGNEKLPPPPKKDGKPLTKEKGESPKLHNDPPVPIPELSWELASNTDELAELLKKNVAHVTLANNIYDASHKKTADDMPGMTFQGSELSIVAAEPAKKPTVRLRYDSSPLKDDPLHPGRSLPWVALTIQASKKVTLKGLRLEIDANGTNLEMAALALRTGELSIQDCEFVQKGWPKGTDLRRLSNITVEGALANGARKPSLFLNECYFKSGQEAILMTGAASIRATNCAFGPYSALFHIRGPIEHQDPASVVLGSCSALLENGAAFQFDEDAWGKLTVQHCLFSRPETAADKNGSAVLIRQTGEKPGNIDYEEPQRNVYHNLRAFSIKETPGKPPVLITALEPFQQKGTVVNYSVELTDSPWRTEEPLKLLDEDKPEAAFQVSDKLKDLRQVIIGDKFIGVERCAWGDVYQQKPSTPVAVVSRNKIVDPTAVSRSSPGVYRHLRQALADAEPGDVIHIRHTGLLEIDSVTLDKPAIDLTIKPHSGHVPVLTLGRPGDHNAALFILHDGKLVLEDLQFRLKPSLVEFKSQAVLKVVGAGEGTFKRCAATLEKAENVKMALIVLGDPNDVMKMDPPATRTGPNLRLENCFVRGDGDLVFVRASRKFDLQLEQSLVALNGSLLVVIGNPKDPPDKPSLVALKRVTAFVNDHLVWLQACKEETRVKGLVPTHVTMPTDCLFATDNNKTLVRLDDVDTDEQMRRCFTWSGGNHNAFSGYNMLLEQQPRKDEIAPEPYNRSRWEAWTNEGGFSLFTKVQFSGPQNPERWLSRALPSDFKVVRPSSEWQAFGGEKCGADVDSLPVPRLDD